MNIDLRDATYMPMVTLDTTKDTSAERMAVSNNSRTAVLLRATGLRIAFGGQVVLDGVDLELRQGEVVLLRGENGSGKTTLLNILTGCLEPDAGTIQYLIDSTPRTFQFPRRWWQEPNPFDHFTPEFVAREGVGRTWQDIRLFGSQSLRDNIAVAQPNQPGENPIFAVLTPNRSARDDIQLDHDSDVILGKLGLAGREASSADKVSLGQSKRVAIARAVAAGARVLFLDEPLAGLDHQGIADVLVLLKTLVEERKITLVIVEHVSNQAHLDDLITTHWLLEKGKLQGSDKKASLTVDDQGLHTNVNNAYPAWLNLLAGDSAEIIDELLPYGAILTRIRRLDRFHSTAKPILEIRNLVVRRGGRKVIGLNNDGQTGGFNLTVYVGEIIILQAPNGWGKTTLMEAVAGLLASSEGEICLLGNNVFSASPWIRRRLGLVYVPAAHNVANGLKVEEQFSLARVSSIPSNVKPFLKTRISSLSGGQKQLVALSVATSTPHATVKLFDEPLSMLDETRMREIIESLLPQSAGATIVTVPNLNRQRSAA